MPAKPKIQEVDPFAVKREESPFSRSKEVLEKQRRCKKTKGEVVTARNSVMAELANNLKRSSSSNLSQPGEGIDQIAEEYFREHFRLPGGFFTVKSPEEATLKNQDLGRQLGIVEENLGRELA